MSKTIVFIQIADRPGMVEAELQGSGKIGDLMDALKAAGVDVDDGTFVFVDEAEDNVQGERHELVCGLKNGCRIHVSRCKRVKTTVNYLEKSEDREFPPGARVRAVKQWAVRTFGMDPKDAAEHVLQICRTTERPSSDTTLSQLLKGEGAGHCGRCSLCFDLVPDKRVEG